MSGLGKALEQSCFQLLFPRQTERASQGWSFGFPSPEPQCSCLKMSSCPRTQAAHISQHPSSSSALGPLGPPWDMVGCPNLWGQARQSQAPRHNPVFRCHTFTLGQLHGIALAHTQHFPPQLWPLQASGPPAVPPAQGWQHRQPPHHADPALRVTALLHIP